MSKIVSPCNGLKRCWRHSCGCAKIILTAREEYEIRQRYKARRGRLWHIVREHYRVSAKWGLDPIPPRHHVDAVLLMEKVRGEVELSQSIKEMQRRTEKE